MFKKLKKEKTVDEVINSLTTMINNLEDINVEKFNEIERLEGEKKVIDENINSARIEKERGLKINKNIRKLLGDE